MIIRVEGILRRVEQNKVALEVGNLWYEVWVPSSTFNRLPSLGETLILNTLEIIEGESIGTTMRPRLLGFIEPIEREFFQMFTSVSGLGVKKALKAMQMPISEIAAAIELGNEKILRKLPEIGPKTAKKIIAELQGKMSKFALLQESAPSGKYKTSLANDEISDEAFYVLTELLHYSQKEADSLIQSALETDEKFESSEQLLQTIFRMRAAKN